MVGRLGRYELHDVLGTGGFATVYRATDPSLQAVVAVKVLADNWSRDPEIRRRFRAEAVLLRRVQAGGSVQGLVEVYDIDEDASGQPYFVMGYADQGTLAERSRAACWSPADVVPVVDALAETVGALHDNQIVHRDLKPTNVLIRSDRLAGTAGPGRLVARHERLLVADLGLARDLRRDTTSMSFAGGTRRYLAPEQLDGRVPVDQRTDVHAASAIIAELLEAGDRAGVASEAEPRVSPALRRALERGLAVDPGERFVSMACWRRGLLDAIDADAGGRPVLPADRARPTPVEAQELASPGLLSSGASRPSNPARWALAAAAGLVALALLAWIAAGIVADDGIVGPDEIVVGETVRYRVPERQDQPVVWIGPNGEQVRDQDLEVRAVVPGELRIELLAGGDRATRTIMAVPSPVGPSVEGPGRARLGQSIVLRPSSPAGASGHYWLDPSGARVDEEALRLTPTRPGTFSVTLVVRGEDGIERGVRHQVEVVP